MAQNNIEKVYSLTPMQKGMLFNYIKSGNSTYFVQKSINLQGKFNIDNAVNSFKILSRKYDVLRTSIFYNSGSEPKQIVLKNREIEVNVIELDEQKSIKSIEEADIRRGFDLTKDSLLRATIILNSSSDITIIWSFNHIILDGWCMSILLNDFFKYYEMLNDGNGYKEILSSIGKTFDYKKYIDWLNIQDFTAARKYWSDFISDYDEDFTFESREENFKKCNDGILQYNLNTNQIEEYKKFCNRTGITLSVLLEFCWGVFLAKKNFTKDIVFGKVVSGRRGDLPGIEGALGLFINTVPTRVNFKDNLSSIEYLKHLYSTNLDSEQFDYFPLFETLKLKNHNRNLINSLFIFENYYVDNNPEDQIKNLKLTIDNKPEHTEYPLTLAVINHEGYELDINYNPGIFSRDEIAVYMNQFVTLIDSVIKFPNKPISELSLCDENEKSRVLSYSKGLNISIEFNSIFDQFEHQVNNRPEDIAIVSEEKTVTYCELSNNVSKIESFLVRQGIKEGDRIILLFDKNIELIASMLASIKLGCTYVPVDKKFSKERLLFIIEDSNARIILSDSNTVNVSELRSFNVRKVISTQDIYLSDTKPKKINNEIQYILYTSGTTGNPKGVLVKEKSVINLVNFLYNEIYHKYQGANIGLIANPIFDASVQQIFTSLMFGSSLYLIDDSLKYIPKKLYNYINENNIRIIDGTPSYIDLLVGQYESNSLNVDLYVIGGENLTSKVLGQIYRASPSSTVYNVYGPTEATVDSTFYKCGRKDIELSRIPIGKPIYNVEVKIKNDNQICGIGQIGEIVISGEGLSLGYTNLDLNKDVFRKTDDVVEYFTGDLGYWNSEGNMITIGRRDSQIKLNGYRIELEEIDKCLSNIKGVVASHSLVEKKNIYSFVVSNKSLSSAYCKEILAEKLPYYMIPRDIIHLDGLPMTFSGKVDTNQLKEFVMERHEQNSSVPEKDSADMTDSESKVVKAYRTIFQDEKISLSDNFFNLGGDSIQAIRIISLLSDYNIKVADILSYPILKDLSKFIQKNSNYIPQDEVVGEVELLPSHRRFSESISQSVINHFNQSLLIKSNEKLDLNLVNRVYHTLLRHHDSLRISYNYGENFSTLLDYKELKNKQNIILIKCRKSEMESYATKEHQTLSLKDGLVFKIVVFDTEEGEFLLFILHHFTSDAVTLRILFDDFRNLYSHNNDLTSLPLKTVSVKQFASELRDKSIIDLSEDMEFWEENQITFDNSEYLPCKYSEAKKMEVKIDQALINRVQKLVNNNSEIRLHDLLLSCFLESYAKIYKREKQLSIDMEGHGRSSEVMDLNISRTVGWFTTVYPLLFNLKTFNKSFMSKIDYVHDKMESVPNGGLSYELYLKEKNKSKDKFSSIMFNFLGEFESQSYENSTFNLLPVNIGEEVAESTQMQNPLILNISIYGGTLVANFIYDRKIFSNWKLKRLANTFKNKLVDSIKQLELLSSNPKNDNSLINQILSYNSSNGNEYVDIINDTLNDNIYVFPPAMLKVAYLPIYKSLFTELAYKAHIFHLNSDNQLIENIAEYIANNNDTSIILIGYSGGANIAYEVSVCLENKYNKTVDKIIMLDGSKWEDGLEFTTVTEENIDDMLEDFLVQSNLSRESLDENVLNILNSERSNFLAEAKIYQEFSQSNKNKTILLNNTKIYNILSEDVFTDLSKDTRRHWTKIVGDNFELINGFGNHLTMLTEKNNLKKNRKILKDIMASSIKPIMSAKGLSKYYGSGETRICALDSVSIDIYEKEFICILGSSGSGKSTLLNSLSTLEKFDNGELTIFSEKVDHSNKKQLLKVRKDYIGFVFQQYHLLPNLNVRDNIETGRYLSSSNSKVSIERILSLLSLENKLEKYPSQLSGGEQQRVSIARALAKNSKILFCDEPTGALDTENGVKVLKVLKEIQKQENLTIILVTHNIQIAEIADRVIHMRDGKIIEEVLNESPLSVDEVDWN